MRTIPQRDVRNQVAQVLREVEAGELFRITVDGRPVADLVPIAGVRRTFVSREQVAELLRRTTPDPEFARDLEQVAGATIDEL